MATYNCRSCDTMVRRARLCSRCGARQPLLVLRGVLIALALGAAVAAPVVAVRSLQPGVDRLKLRPSNGTWGREEDFSPDDIVPHERSSLFASSDPNQKDETATTLTSP